MEIFNANTAKNADDVDFDSLNMLNAFYRVIGGESHSLLWIIDYKDIHGEYKHRFIKGMVVGEPKFDGIMQKMEEMLQEPYSKLGCVLVFVDISEEDCRNCMNQDFMKTNPTEATELMKKGICLFVDTTY